MMRSSALLLLFVASGCSAQQPMKVSAPLGDSSVPLCALIAAPEKFVGKNLRMQASYKTDNAHYEYLIDAGCAAGVLNVGNSESNQTPSVKRFYESSTTTCAERREQYICVLEADMDVTVKVVKLQSGKFGVDLLEVHSFSFK